MSKVILLLTILVNRRRAKSRTKQTILLDLRLEPTHTYKTHMGQMVDNVLGRLLEVMINTLGWNEKESTTHFEDGVDSNHLRCNPQVN